MKLSWNFITWALLERSLALHVRQFADSSADDQLGSIFGTAIASQVLKGISLVGAPGTPASGTAASHVSDFAQATPTDRVEPRCYDECSMALSLDPASMHELTIVQRMRMSPLSE